MRHATGTSVDRRPLIAGLVFVTLVASMVGSLGAPLITVVSNEYGVSLGAAQWTLTASTLVAAVSTPLLGRLGSGAARRRTVMTALSVVVAGSVLTVLPVGAGGLLRLVIGRAAQGVGFGLAPVMMATARDELGATGDGTIAVLAVVSTAGVGVGYPLAGLLSELGGARAAYAAGLVFTSIALVVAGRIQPRPAVPPSASGNERAPFDLAGAVLLSIGLTAILLVLGLSRSWGSVPTALVALAVAGVASLAVFPLVELRASRPIVDVRPMGHVTIAGANVMTLAGGMGMYVLFVLITRYVQIPVSAGYGFGLNGFQAGLVLVPFSICGFVMGRASGRLATAMGTYAVLALSAGAMALAGAVFATTRSNLPSVLAAMVILGVGVGGFWSGLPRHMLVATSAKDTAPVLGFNQVVRFAGFSIGSAICALALDAHTRDDVHYPTEHGYSVTAWIGCAISASCALLVGCTALASRRSTARGNRDATHIIRSARS